MTDTNQDTLLRALHDQHADALWAYCVRLTGDRTYAQDVTQEVLLRAWRHPKVLDQSQRSARAWLFTVARHLVIDQWRTQRAHREVVTDQLPEPRPDSSVEDTDRLLQSWVVAEALDQLSHEHRQILIECYYRGQSVAQAAARLGVPTGTVKSRTHYALRALRLALEEMGEAR
ncbi:sigma-70 family RNA polymerase sigma factor [Leekyejoonella antrihumi]|uniref:RNA polymerase sigma factor n=1 Tax=Leekyejoonella antrihumi TaxID=1660198 RepID=A0A563E4S8_9MICO|nr:sigma-70 family RNA polymerase sigma factor [Leekyejoonella antrihumi]TWP37299.1 sigma-70 family RNA polymerase sigma factor [Leekyejoonella antrihumi]